MTKRAIIPDARLVQDFVYTQQQLPTNKPVVQYVRQSTNKQLKRNKQSYEMQDSDLRRKLTRGYGWQDNDQFIIKIDSDQGKSGTKRRDERTGLDKLYYLLENGLAGAVAAFDVSRLYRVLSRAEYGAFCDLVLERKIPVITFSRIYWPTRTDNDQLNDDFRAAAMFIEEIIKGKLIEANRRHVQFDSSYGGGSVPFGFIVAGLGDETADRKYYVIYEPHATLVRWLFKRFRALGGNLPLLARELTEVDFRFPPFEQGIVTHPGLKADEDGSYPLRSRRALISILTNKSYIGWYEFGGTIVSREAHEPIVPMDDFLYAFERLSGVDLDGTEKQERKPRERRYAGATALLDGVLQSGELPVYCTGGRYQVRRENNDFHVTELAVQIKALDAAFSQALIALLATLELKRADSELTKRIHELQQEQVELETDFTKSIARIDREIANLEMARRISQEEGDEQGYRQATRELVQLRKDRAALEAKANQASGEVEELGECHNLLECAVQNWQGMKIDKRKRLVKLVVERADIAELSEHFIGLHVVLDEPVNSTLTLYLYRPRGSQVKWSDEEDELLAQLFPTEDKQAIMQALPTRSWNSICFRGYEKLGIRRAASRDDILTWNDEAVMCKYGASVDRPVYFLGDGQSMQHVTRQNWASVPDCML
jgi:DNA invertase Pin-like site-specific DNA recombinase